MHPCSFNPPTQTDLPPISFWFNLSSLFWEVSYGVFEEKEQCHAPSDEVVSHGEEGKERSKERREGKGMGGEDSEADKGWAC
jgi:hypothetical protein